MRAKGVVDRAVQGGAETDVEEDAGGGEHDCHRYGEGQRQAQANGKAR
jgi:hypothetical protein